MGDIIWKRTSSRRDRQPKCGGIEPREKNVLCTHCIIQWHDSIASVRLINIPFNLIYGDAWRLSVWRMMGASLFFLEVGPSRSCSSQGWWMSQKANSCFCGSSLSKMCHVLIFQEATTKHIERHQPHGWHGVRGETYSKRKKHVISSSVSVHISYLMSSSEGTCSAIELLLLLRVQGDSIFGTIITLSLPIPSHPKTPNPQNADRGM